MADHLGLVEADDRLGQGVVVGVAAAADRGLDAGLGEALGVADREVLDAAVAVVDEAVETSPPRRQRAISRASRARSVRSELDACQPTIKRE